MALCCPRVSEMWTRVLGRRSLAQGTEHGRFSSFSINVRSASVRGRGGSRDSQSACCGGGSSLSSSQRTSTKLGAAEPLRCWRHWACPWLILGSLNFLLWRQDRGGHLASTPSNTRHAQVPAQAMLRTAASCSCATCKAAKGPCA